MIVLSLENNFEKLQMIIVLMKQMWKTAYQTGTVKKEHRRLTYRDGGVCILVCSLSLFLEVQVLCHQSLGISPKFLCAVWWFASHSCFDGLTVVCLGDGLELCFPS